MADWEVIVYIPAYNAEKTLPELLRRFQSIKASSSFDIKKIIFVDDGSTDNSQQILSAASEGLGYVEVIGTKTNEGPVNAILMGMKKALEHKHNPEKTIFVRMDSDLEHQPEDIGKITEPIISGNKKIVVGFVSPDSRSGMVWGWFNRHIGNDESRALLNIAIPQFCPGFVAVRGDLLQELTPALVTNAEKFKVKYGISMVSLDLVLLHLARLRGESIGTVEISAIEDRYFQKNSLVKLKNYFDVHFKTMDFVKSHDFKKSD